MMKDAILHIFLKNKFFLIPCIVWIIMAGILMLVFPFDILFYSINRLHTPAMDKLMTVLSAFGRGDSILLVFVILLVIPALRSWQYFFTTLSFGIVIPVCSYFGKQIYSQPRPLAFFLTHDIHTVKWLDNLFNNSFPSGHTMGAFGFFLLLNHFLPAGNKMASLFFFLMALGCGYSRIYLGQHFFSDVLAGSITGLVMTLGIMITVHQLLKPKTHA